MSTEYSVLGTERVNRVKRIGLLLVFVFVAAPLCAQEPAPVKETTVGISGRIEGIVIPGPELVTRKIEDRTKPVVVWFTRTYPHGTDFRYDLEYYGLDPGTYNLAEQFRRKDGTPVGTLPPERAGALVGFGAAALPTDLMPAIWVKVNPIRPPGQVRPNDLEIEKASRLGGYRWIAIGAAAVWGLGLLAIVAWMLSPLFRSRKVAAGVRTVSLADRLRPLVQGAIAGKLSQEELAKLERGLFALWRKRLNLEAAEPAVAITKLRKHPDAGPLLGQLEEWLHKPGPQTPVDVPTLLAPYRDLPPDALEL